MGKKKGGKSAVESNGDIDDEISAIENTPTETKKGDKKSKKANKKDYEDEVADELEKLSMNDDTKNNSKQNGQDKKSKKKKNKKNKNESDSEEEEEVMIQPKLGGGFAALMDDDDDDDDQPMMEEEDVPEPVKKVEEDKGGKKSKKAKKKGKKNDDDEEDLDKILAELASEYKGEKPKPKEKEPSVEKEREDSVEPKSEEIEDSAAAKKRKKKEAQKLRLQQEAEAAAKKTQEPPKDKKEEKEKLTKEVKEVKEVKPETPTPEPPKKEDTPAPEDDEEEGDDDESGKKKKKKKKKKGEKEDEEDKKKSKPNKKVIAAMQEALAKQREEEERLKKEEEERERQEEERIRKIEEAKRLEEERKERKKQKEKERRERLKAEGKLLTTKQKQDQRRAQAMLEHLKAQGVDIPLAGEKAQRPSYGRGKSKRNKDKEDSPKLENSEPKPEQNGIESGDKQPEVKEEIEEEKEEPKDNWDEESEEDDEEEDSQATKTSQETSSTKNEREKEASDEEEEEDDEDEEEEDSEFMSEAEKKKARALSRIHKRKIANQKKVNPDILRAPVVCVLGHVDHGKTKILDKLRRTNVQEGEVGGITQQIGATNVPSDAIRNQCKLIKDFNMDSLKFPGLLIIDTPGHESFSNLRTRGSSLCDIAILVVDITQGLEPQTIESINLLKAKKTPFIVALNKVDRVFEWESHPSKDIRDVIKLQNEPCRNDFERRTKDILLAFNNQGLNAALFWENPDPRSYLSLVPTSAISGDGMGNLVALICNLCQTRLAQRLMFNEELQCTVLEVKTIQGHGTTIDVILVNGRMREGDTIVLAGTEGPITTQIRSLLLPKPMKEIRVKGQYDEHKEIMAAQGVKIAARELEKAIAGLNLKIAYHDDEVELLKEQVDKEFSNAMKAIKVKDRGVYVQASTLGALEALLEFFKTNNVPYSGIRVGPVVKRDVMKAAAMLEHDPMYAVILAFDVKVERDAQDLADKEGVKIFSEETIYHLGDRYVEYLKDFKKKRQDEFKHIAVFPSRLKIIPTAIFNKRDPIVLGVTVESGVLREGTPLCVPSKEFVEIGVVTSLEFDHKTVELARKGVDVCIKIEPLPGHTPKLFGRHFEATDMLVSRISRESINACKDYFREDLSKTDWKLMAELKKQFGIF